MSGTKVHGGSRRGPSKGARELGFSWLAGRTFMVRPQASNMKVRRSEAQCPRCCSAGSIDNNHCTLRNDERSDSFLIMDVNPNRAPWVWVRSDELIAAMRTFDTVENRGYLLVSDVE